MRIRLDYALSANATQRWVWWWLVAAILASGAAVWQYTQLEAQRADLHLRLQDDSQLSEAPKPVVLSSEDSEKLREQAKQANAVLKELGLPWPALFALLEQTASPEIALLIIRPDAAKGRIRISGEARNLADVLQYVRDLSTEGTMSDVVLEQHEVVEADPQKPVRFTLSSHWGI